MNRTATVLAATVAALLLSAAPAYADAPVVTDPWSGEVVDCFDEPIEYEPGVWVCTSVEDAAAWGLDTPVEEAPRPRRRDARPGRGRARRGRVDGARGRGARARHRRGQRRLGLVRRPRGVPWLT